MSLQDFFKEVSKVLGRRFEWDEEERTWTCNIEGRTQGSVMVINGQRVEQPGPVIKVVSKIIVVSSEDYIENEDGTREMLVNLTCNLHVNDEQVINEGFLCHYENETELDPLLNMFLTKIYLK